MTRERRPSVTQGMATNRGANEEEASDPDTLYRNPEAAASWKTRVRAVVARALGAHQDLVANSMTTR